MNETEYASICNSAGRSEDPGDNSGPILSAQRHTGFNKYYKDYTFKNEFSKKTFEITGIQTATLGKFSTLALCFLQSIHATFY